MLTHAPFDERGNLLDSVTKYDVQHGRCTMLPNEPFEATLELVDYARGRSSVSFRWRDEQGRVWPMFIRDLLDLVLAQPIVGGKTERLRWYVRKRGQNYGVAMLID